MKEFFEQPNNTENTEELKYRARASRDRAIVAIPEILWRAGEHADVGREQEQSVVPSEALDAKILELYSLAQEYALIPQSVSALERSKQVNAFAGLDTTDDEIYLKQLEELLTEPVKNGDISEGHEILEEEKTEVSFKEAITHHKESIKKDIMHLMQDSVLRDRYFAELSAERSQRRSLETRTKLKEVLKLRALKSRLHEQRRHMQVEEFLIREKGAGKPRQKLPGRTPQALINLERGADIAESQEAKKTEKLSTPERGLLVAESLLQRKRELEEKGFILSPSRERLISEIAELTAQGYRVFLGGPTGTGKTSLALFALREMTGGSYSWVTWTGETSVRDLFGSPKLTTNESGKVESGMTKGPVTKGFIGERRGILHEEFTAGQTGVQMSMKTLWATRPGEQINLPGFNGTEFPRAELMEIATGNLKGKRHQERETMDPAVAREFKALDVPFMSAEETRDYLILPAIMDRTGVMPVSRAEVEMITQFCRAAELSQMAYLEEIPEEIRTSDLYKIISPSGEPIALTNVFLDTGTVKDLFSGWRASGKPLSAYLHDGLRRFIDNNPHFKENETERQIMKNILSAYGFNLEAQMPDEFFAISKGRSYLKPSELGFLLAGSPPSADDEFPGGQGGDTDENTETEAERLEREKKEAEKAEKMKTEEGKAEVELEAIKKKELELKRVLKKAKREVLGETFNPVISTEYKYKDEKGKEVKESLEIDFDKKLTQAIKFYQEHKIKAPADFENQMVDIWERNRDAMQEQMEKLGFDEILIIPAGIKMDEALDQEMTKGYKKKDGTVGEPTYWDVEKTDIISKRNSKSRIIMVHKNKAKDLYDTPDTLPILKETLGKKAGSFKPEEGLTVEEYFLFQRLYYEETGEHLDEKGSTWLPGSGAGSFVLRADWYPGFAQVIVGAYSPDFAYPFIGCRLSRRFD